MTHPVLSPGKVAVVTGGAAGIGLASAVRFARAGMAVVIADLGAARLAAAEEALRAAGAPEVIAAECDVSVPGALDALAARVTERWGAADLVMNNAAIQSGSQLFGPREVWERVLSVNLWGVIDGVRAFVPAMIARGAPGVVINTGSKQGITTPPGDPAYNLAKAGVKVVTEALAHELRQAAPKVSAHLLIPGFVWTDLTRGDRTEKPAGAWTPDETADFLIERLAAGDFYILCPDNEVTRDLDEKRIAWAAGDIIENRPALSRWHPDWAEAFRRSMEPPQ